MMILCSILLEFVTLVASPSVIDDFPLRTDYYKSMTDPQICMEVYHFYPTGPINLYGKIIYKRFPNLHENETKTINVIYPLNRIDQPCETSVIFSTFGDDFSRIEIKIELSLAKGSDCFSSFEYKFYRGFKIGTYTLMDVSNKFGIRIKVTNETENYIKPSINYERMYSIFEKSAKTTNNALCIITENNVVAVWETENEITDSSYLITDLEAEIFLNYESIGWRKYHAYSCMKDEGYPDVPIIFIIDEEKIKIIFKIHYRKHFADAMTYIDKFDASNPLFDYVHNLKNIPTEFTKVFLIKSDYDYKYCEDGSKVYIYSSRDKTIYFTFAKKEIDIFYLVKGVTRIYRSSKDPCPELKK